MRLFKRTNSSFQSVAGQRFADEHYERHLQDWVYQNPQLIADDLLMLGKEVITDDGKRIDLLALDKDGNTVILELKRGETTRDLVGQITGYLSAVEQWDERELERRTSHQPRTLDKAFCQRFNCTAPAEFNAHQRGVVIVESIDEMTLRTFKRLGIRVLTFSYLKSAEEEYILVNDLAETPAVPAPRATRARVEAATKEITPEDAEQLTKNDAFLRYYDAQLAPAIKRDVFKPQDGWRFGRSREDGAVYIHHADWGSSWEGFVVGLQDDEAASGDIWLGLWMAVKRGEPLVSELRPQEKALRESLGKSFRFGDDPNGDGLQFPIWEPGHTQNNTKLILEKLAAYKHALLASVNRIMETKSQSRRESTRPAPPK